MGEKNSKSAGVSVVTSSNLCTCTDQGASIVIVKISRGVKDKNDF